MKKTKKTLLASILLSSLFLVNVFANSMQDITESVRSVCLAPDQKGKYWSVKGSGDAKVKIKILGVKTGIDGEVSSKEWDGIREILKEQQAGDNNSYRDCVKDITRVFLKNFKVNTPAIHPILIKDGDFSLDLTVYEEGDIPKKLGDGLVIQKINNKMVVSGLNKASKGIFQIDNVNLKNKFRVEMIVDLNYGHPSFILRTRDDDIDNDIKITMNTFNIQFGERDSLFSSANFKKNEINEFVIYKKNDVIKLHINDKYFSSKQSSKNIIYNKLIIKGIKQEDYIYDITGYNITN